MLVTRYATHEALRSIHIVQPNYRMISSDYEEISGGMKGQTADLIGIRNGSERLFNTGLTKIEQFTEKSRLPDTSIGSLG